MPSKRSSAPIGSWVMTTLWRSFSLQLVGHALAASAPARSSLLTKARRGTL